MGAVLLALIPSRAKMWAAIVSGAIFVITVVRIMSIAEGRRRAKTDGLKKAVDTHRRMRNANAKARTDGSTSDRMRDGKY